MSTNTTFRYRDSPVLNPIIQVGANTPAPANVTFYVGDKELLKLSNDGFYVRGKKLDVDDNEAEHVYKAFREFLIWSALIRN
jgi:hypothetical protein